MNSLRHAFCNFDVVCVRSFALLLWAGCTATGPSAVQAALLRGTAQRGQRPTKRQRLRQELLAQRLGVALQVGSAPPLAAKGPALITGAVLRCSPRGLGLPARVPSCTMQIDSCSVCMAARRAASAAHQTVNMQRPLKTGCAQHRAAVLAVRDWRWTGGCRSRRVGQMRQILPRRQPAGTRRSATAGSRRQVGRLQGAGSKTAATVATAAQMQRRHRLAGKCALGQDAPGRPVTWCQQYGTTAHLSLPAHPRPTLPVACAL
jgi:hypothetical protein